MTGSDPIRDDIPVEGLNTAGRMLTRVWMDPWAAADYAARDADPIGTSARDESGGNKPWSGTATYAESVTMAHDGWKDGAATLGLSAGVDAQIRLSTRPAATWSQVGSQVDMGAYLAGEPDCMISMVRTIRQAPLLRIVVERAIPGIVDEREVRSVGATVANVVEALRLNGIPSEIWSVVTLTAAKYAHPGVQYAVRAQAAGSMVDADILAYWIAHPAALRRTAFRWMELESAAFRKGFNATEDGSYGTVPPAAGPEDPRYAHLDADTVAPTRSMDAERWAADLLDRHGISMGGAK